MSPARTMSAPSRFRRWLEADPNNRRGAIVAGALVVALLIVLVVKLAPSGSSPKAVACAPLAVGVTTLPDGSTFTSEEAYNANELYGIVMRSGVDDPTQAAVDVLTAAWTESRMLNLSSGDRDSVGFFQERPSEGWGTAADIIIPTYATGQWLDRLETIDGWADQSPAEVAQEVERSGYPGRYTAWVTIARTQVLSETGPATTCGGGTRGSTVVRVPA